MWKSAADIVNCVPGSGPLRFYLRGDALVRGAHGLLALLPAAGGLIGGYLHRYVREGDAKPGAGKRAGAGGGEALVPRVTNGWLLGGWVV